MNTFDQLVANFEGSTRHETLNGREYIVAPLSMIVPGVLNGSQGAGYYPLSEIKDTTDAWNNMPIVVNHPTDSKGKGISARNPKVLEATGIGTVFNATTNDKLVAEGWFDIEKTKAVDSRIYDKLVANEPFELSTGLTLKKQKRQGVVNKQKYDWIGTSYKPDHLAVLPDKKGACSMNDGCGVLVNEEGETKPVTNKLSFDDIRTRLAKAVTDELNIGIPTGASRNYAWVADIYANEFVYETDGALFSRSYSVDKKTDVITLGDTSTPVRRKSGYEPVANGEGCGCQECKDKSKKKKKASKMKIREITGNAAKKDKKSGANCGIGPNGFSSGNTCARGSGRAGKGKAVTARKGKAATKKVSTSSGSSAADLSAQRKSLIAKRDKHVKEYNKQNPSTRGASQRGIGEYNAQISKINKQLKTAIKTEKNHEVLMPGYGKQTKQQRDWQAASKSAKGKAATKSVSAKQMVTDAGYQPMEGGGWKHYSGPKGSVAFGIESEGYVKGKRGNWSLHADGKVTTGTGTASLKKALGISTKKASPAKKTTLKDIIAKADQGNKKSFLKGSTKKAAPASMKKGDSVTETSLRKNGYKLSQQRNNTLVYEAKDGSKVTMGYQGANKNKVVSTSGPTKVAAKRNANPPKKDRRSGVQIAADLKARMKAKMAKDNEGIFSGRVNSLKLREIGSVSKKGMKVSGGKRKSTLYKEGKGLGEVKAGGTFEGKKVLKATKTKNRVDGFTERDRHVTLEGKNSDVSLKSLASKLSKNKKYSQVDRMDSSLDGNYIQALHKGGTDYFRFGSKTPRGKVGSVPIRKIGKVSRKTAKVSGGKKTKTIYRDGNF